MRATSDLPGPAKLAAWLEKNSLSKRRAARGLGVSAPTLLDWLDGTKTPTPNNRTAIQNYTGGDVGEEDWMSEAELEERRRVNSIQRFEPETPDAA